MQRSCRIRGQPSTEGCLPGLPPLERFGHLLYESFVFFDICVSNKSVENEVNEINKVNKVKSLPSS